ncbi:MAG: orotate phosphoribosyltransferase [Burkholderiaceae bacterium]|jgi:orotate phosphoribosyltransferase|nr:orotate phosphoribosyltransferase [Burkholderiaceae bacterium]
MTSAFDPRPADQEFIRFAIDTGVLRFGRFITKAGRESPYFFNAGLFDHGGTLGALADFYAKTFLAAEFDGRLQANGLFGPAYKGITLASATAVALAKAGRDIGFSYNRKEAKDHGEGGIVVGKKLEGRVLIIDDVISAGTSVRESVEIIRAHGATPAGVLIALDRMERGGTAAAPTERSAVQEVQDQYGIPVIAIATLADLLQFLQASDDNDLIQHRDAVAAYRKQWGVG